MICTLLYLQLGILQTSMCVSACAYVVVLLHFCCHTYTFIHVYVSHIHIQLHVCSWYVSKIYVQHVHEYVYTYECEDVYVNADCIRRFMFTLAEAHTICWNGLTATLRKDHGHSILNPEPRHFVLWKNSGHANQVCLI